MIGDAGNGKAAFAFDVLSAAFEGALQTRPEELLEQHVVFAGRPAKIRIVGRRLAHHLIRPFDHLLRVDGAALKSDLHIDVWDRRVAGVNMGEFSDQLGTTSNRTEASRNSRYTFNHHQNTTVCFDHKNSRIVGCCTDADELSLYELGRPLHVPLVHWHNEQDVPIVHAGLVEKSSQGIMFAGPAGVGKSTSAVTCLTQGFGFLSDDLMGMEELPDGNFKGHSIYNSTYFDAGHLGRFPLLASHAIRGRDVDEEKVLVLLSGVFPSRMERAAGIRAVVLPELGGGTQSKCRPATPARALMALAPPTLPINKELGASGFGKLGRLVESVPCFHLALGSRLDGIPDAVDRLLDEL